MTALEIRERLEKAQEVLAKKLNTITKKTASREKKVNLFNSKFDFEYTDIENHRNLERTVTWDEAYDLAWDIKSLDSDLESLERKVEEQKEIINNWQTKYNIAVAKETTPRIPVIEKFLNNWFEDAKEFYLDTFEKIKNILVQQNGWKKFKESNLKDYYREYLDRANLDKMLQREVARKRDVLLNQIARTINEDINYDSVDAKYLTIDGRLNLNGRLIVNNKVLTIETIIAGGYNIQRLHYRTLVHLYK